MIFVVEQNFGLVFSGDVSTRGFQFLNTSFMVKFRITWAG